AVVFRPAGARPALCGPRRLLPRGRIVRLVRAQRAAMPRHGGCGQRGHAQDDLRVLGVGLHDPLSRRETTAGGPRKTKALAVSREGFRALASDILHRERNFPFLADLAATYSSKP